MSVFRDAVGAIKQVVLMQSRIDQVDQRIGRLGVDVERLAEAHGALRDRVARLEGIIEGAAMAAGQRRIES